MYRVEPVGDDIVADIDALPADLLAEFGELRAVLEVSPWTVGRPLLSSNPAGLRVATLGAGGGGMVVFHVIEHERIVPIVQVTFI